MTRRLLPTLLVALGALALPSAAPARTNVAVGIGDQSPTMFASQAYKDLKLKKTRYFIRWNAIADPTELRLAEQFVSAANAAGVRVLMHVSTDNLAPKAARLPSRAEYTAKVRPLVQRFRQFGVKEWGAWNEVNHDTQPTYKSPKRAAEFYREMRNFCSGCKIVALDILDQSGVEKYIARWFSAAGSAGRSAKVIGIHNYSEVNRTKGIGTNRYPGTPRIVKAVRKKNKVAEFWYTETGGLVSFGDGFPCSESRQKSRTERMFKLVKQYAKLKVRRLYTYNWTGTDCTNRFDAGLVKLDGTPRPAYHVLKAQLKNFKR